ncbi:hypothetical protein [Pseudoruegeria sp. HB172150]|uniref:hypothetical protein n=1 Tax=Pseudoruegeria sp. HB172150 TaxID=2721164 RepID=UPI001553D411|nr:hypothetical protein [Pseudoruegeria sp. HB172150]
MTTGLAAFLALFLALPAAAQTVVDSTLSDLDGDGTRERFTIIDHGDGIVDLIVEEIASGLVSAPDIAWIGGIGQEPELDLAPNGSVRLTSMNESIGRDRWHLTLTIAYRGGAYMVAGYTFDWYDTLDPANTGACDLNLLNGKGFVRHGEGPKHAITHTVPARPITEWKDDVPVPAVCSRETG